MESIKKKKMKAISILLVTLILGILLGGALVGRIVNERLDRFQEFTTEEGFVSQYSNIIGKMSPDQQQAVLHLLKNSGTEVETLIKATREEFAVINDRLEKDLQEHLSDEQLKAIIDRRNTIRQRLNNR